MPSLYGRQLILVSDTRNYHSDCVAIPYWPKIDYAYAESLTLSGAKLEITMVTQRKSKLTLLPSMPHGLRIGHNYSEFFTRDVYLHIRARTISLLVD